MKTQVAPEKPKLLNPPNKKHPLPNGKTKRKPRRIFLRFRAPAFASPTIKSPGANDYVPPGVDLTVTVETDRPDLAHIVTLKDVTPPVNQTQGPLLQVPVAPGLVFTFNVEFPGALLLTDRFYELRVFIDPAEGGTHQDHSINVHTFTEEAPPRYRYRF